MVYPVIPYGIKGVIWYQGESNVPMATHYRKLFSAMVPTEFGGGGGFMAGRPAGAVTFHCMERPLGRFTREVPTIWRCRSPLQRVNPSRSARR